MFTGIVQALQPVYEKVELKNAITLRIDLGEKGKPLTENIELGASIAINGTCLTVTKEEEIDGKIIVNFDVMGETIACTNLGAIKKDSRLNVERSMKFGDELGGHVLSGHIDGTAAISDITKSENNQKVRFDLSDMNLAQYIVSKGYVAVDGISLTVVDADKTGFSVCLIPETLARTTLGIKVVGDLVNIEVESTTKIIVETMKSILPSMLENYMKK